MSTTVDLWQQIRSAGTAQAEKDAVEAFRSHTRDAAETVAIYLTDSEGNDVAMDRWHLQEGPLRVHLEIGGETRGDAWTPVHRDNLALMLLE